MSILIKGLAMPKNCIFCPMAHWNKLDEITGCEIVIGKKYVDKDDKDYWCGSDIPSWCPLVEIPSHGRLMQDRCKYDASSELISRQDAIDAMEQAKEQYFDRRVIIGKMQDIVNNLPSADAEMNSKLFRIGEVLVEVSKEHITAEQGVKKIGVIMRGYDI